MEGQAWRVQRTEYPWRGGRRGRGGEGGPGDKRGKWLFPQERKLRLQDDVSDKTIDK